MFKNDVLGKFTFLEKFDLLCAATDNVVSHSSWASFNNIVK